MTEEDRKASTDLFCQILKRTTLIGSNLWEFKTIQASTKEDLTNKTRTLEKEGWRAINRPLNYHHDTNHVSRSNFLRDKKRRMKK